MALVWRRDHGHSAHALFRQRLYAMYRQFSSELLLPADLNESTFDSLLATEDVQLLTAWNMPDEWLPLRGKSREMHEARFEQTDAAVAGFSLGYNIGSDSSWWTDVILDVPYVGAALSQEEHQVFVLIGVFVTPNERGRGVRQRLHDNLIAAQSRTAVAKTPTNRNRYPCQQWGWTKIGRVRAFADDSPNLGEVFWNPRRGASRGLFGGRRPREA
jgi:hypothetical protein